MHNILSGGQNGEERGARGGWRERAEHAYEAANKIRMSSKAGKKREVLLLQSIKSPGLMMSAPSPPPSLPAAKFDVLVMRPFLSTSWHLRGIIKC